MKTRIYVGLIALAALAFVGCAKDEVKSSVDNAIEFGTYLGRDAQTKGSVLDNAVETGLAKQGFGVYAYYTGQTAWKDYTSKGAPNFMNNEKVTSADGTNWTYAPVKYWPNNPDDKVSFFAYAPYSETGENSNPTFDAQTGKIDFTVPVDVTDHIDLTAADATENKDLVKQSVTGKVLFTFKHALSRVGFKVEAVIDEVNDQKDGDVDADPDTQENPIAEGTTISVQEVELIGDFYESGKLDLDTFAWSDRVTYDDTFNGYLLEYKNGDFVKTVSEAVTVKKQVLNTNSEYMMLIPINQTSIQVRVKYTVTTTDPKLAGEKSEIVNNITSAPFTFSFEQGKAYNFVLHLGLTSVKLNAEVANWAEEVDYVVNVPNNKPAETAGGDESGN